MEKKTIGKFISTLRKANGMTQKELGEKLFVSDKTVSRWECDECTPDLSLIPSIAEIFGVTTDELLRGEKNNPERDIASSDESANKQKIKSDKQFKLMLSKNNRKYKNLTLISVAITIFGVIAAMVACLGYSNDLIALCLAAAFCVASETCQISFSINAYMTPEEDDPHIDKLQEVNTSITKATVAVSFANLLSLAFCLGLPQFLYGYGFGCSLLFAAIAFALGYIIYSTFIRKALIQKELLILHEKQLRVIKENRKLFFITFGIALVIGACIIAVNTVVLPAVFDKLEHKFTSVEDFKAFMESDYDNWLKGEPPHINTGNDDPPQKHYEWIYTPDGEAVEYYYNPNLYAWTEISADEAGTMPIQVLTIEDYGKGMALIQPIIFLLHALIVVDFAVAAVIYFSKRKKSKERTQ